MKLKSMFLSLVLAVSATMAMAQPNGFTYQAVIRDAGGNLVKNQSVSLQVYLLTSDFSSWYYAEEQKATTNGYGQLSIVVGQGTPINPNLLFSNVNWNNDIYLQLKVDIYGGSDYVDMGYTKIQAVPYALYAANAANGGKGDKGDKGDPGKSLTYRGYWYDEGEYHFNDYVLAPSSADPSINSMWVAQTDNVEVGTEPRNQTSGQWAEVVIPKGDDGSSFVYRGWWWNEGEFHYNDYVLATSSSDPMAYSMWIAQSDNIEVGTEPRNQPWNWVEIVIPRGEKGAGLNYRGAWYNEATYKTNDYVLAPSSADQTINSLWIALSDNITSGNEPREETWNWAEVLIPKGDKGDSGTSFVWCGTWYNGGSYNCGNLVLAPSSSDPSVNSMWVAQNDNISGVEPRFDGNWSEIPLPKGEKGEQGKGLSYRGDWVNGGQYNSNDYVIAKSSYDETINSIWIAQNQINGSTSEPRYDLADWAEIRMPQGPQGIKGEPGQQGPKGEPGIGFTYAGQWASVNAYSRGNYVFAPSTDDANVQSMWFAIADIAAGSAEPRNSADWVEFKALKGEKGDSGEKGEAGTGLVNRGNWVQGTAYEEGNYVFAPSSTDANINSLWVAQSNFTSNSEPKSDGSHWIELKAPAGPQGEPGPQGADGMQVQGTRGQTLVHNGSTWVATDQFKVSENAMEISEKSGATDDEAIFVVKDKQGRPVFAVYPDGVCVYIDESNAKAKRSGLIVTGRPATKDDNATQQDYLVVNQNGTQVIVDQSEDKAPRSGLIVTGRPATKGGDQQDYLIVNPNGTQVIVDQSTSDKAPRSGLIVTGRPATKGGDQQDYLIVNPNGTQVIVDQSANDKAPRSGLIVTGRPATKDGDAHDYLVVNPNGTQVIVDDELEGDAKAPRSGFIVTGRPATKDGEAANYMKVATDGTKISFDESNAKAKRSGLIITGRPATKDGVESDILEVTPEATRVYVDGSSSKSGFGVDGKGTGNGSGFSVTEKGASSNAGYMNVTAKNFAAGYNAGKQVSGANNTFIGNNAGQANTYGANNVFVGYQAGLNNVGGSKIKEVRNRMIDAGYNNVFVGQGAGKGNIGGNNNVAIGLEAGLKNQQGGENVFIGWRAGYCYNDSYYTDADKTGNVFIGCLAGAGEKENVEDGGTATGRWNTMLGFYAGFRHNSGNSNTFLGETAGKLHVNGDNNTYVGAEAGYNNNEGSNNVFIGYRAGKNETGSNKLYISNSSTSSPLIYGDFENKYVNVTGSLVVTSNKVSRVQGLLVNKTVPDGSSGTWYGISLGTTGKNQTGTLIAMRASCGTSGTAGSKNYGVWAKATDGIENYAIYGEASTAAKCWTGYFVGDVKVTNKLVYTTLQQNSDSLLKKDIKTIEGALDKVLKLRGVSYYWKNSQELGADSTHHTFDNAKHIGVIAQEIEQEFPELVSDDKDGFKTVEYTAIAPILIEAMKEQQTIIEKQQKENDEMKAKLDRLEKMVEELMKKQ